MPSKVNYSYNLSEKLPQLIKQILVDKVTKDFSIICL